MNSTQIDFNSLSPEVKEFIRKNKIKLKTKEEKKDFRIKSAKNKKKRDEI